MYRHSPHCSIFRYSSAELWCRLSSATKEKAQTTADISQEEMRNCVNSASLKRRSFIHTATGIKARTTCCVAHWWTMHQGAWGDRRYSSYSFSTSALDRGEWSASRPGERTPVPIVQEAGWVSEPVWTQGLEEKSFRFCWWSNLGRPARSQTLYWLSYPAHDEIWCIN
jgi:hypothetical protein